MSALKRNEKGELWQLFSGWWKERKGECQAGKGEREGVGREIKKVEGGRGG